MCHCLQKSIEKDFKSTKVFKEKHLRIRKAILASNKLYKAVKTISTT